MTNINVETVIEDVRGCGYRKSGKSGVGLYLMGKGDFESCERLPFPLTVCPCCGGGIGFFRGFKWIIPEQLFNPLNSPICRPQHSTDHNHNHNLCVMCNPIRVGERAGLMWIGEAFYTPEQFKHEARAVGISKKVASIPRGFKLGKDIIYLAHRKAVINFDNSDDPISAGIFMSFCPRRVDIVIDDSNNVPERAVSLKEKLGNRARIIVVKKPQMGFL